MQRLLLSIVATTSFLVVGCSSNKRTSTPPPKPISITAFTEAYADFPTCDSSKPACQEQRTSRYTQGRNANARLWSSGRPLAPFVMRVDSVYGEKDTWTLGGSVVWDEAEENRSAMSSLGSLTAVIMLAAGENLLDSAVVANDIASSTYQKIGNCLTTTEEEPVPKTELTIKGLKTRFSDLTGLEKGAYVQISAPMSQFANFNEKKSAWDEASLFKVASSPNYGTIELWPREKFKGSIASGRVVEIEKPTAFCKVKEN